MAGRDDVLGYSKGHWIAAGVLAVVMLPALLVLRACTTGGESEPQRSAAAPSASGVSASSISAWAYMQQFVRARLNSPSTAKFPYGGHRSVVELGDGRYSVRSYVDADNAFGASVRTHFNGVIRKTATGWELESLDLQ